MASISKRGDSYRVVWRGKDGKQKQRSFDRKRDADAFRSQVEVDLRSGAYVDPQLSRLTATAQWEHFSTNRRVSDGRKALEASMWRKHLSPKWGDVRLEDIDIDSVQAWVHDLEDRLAPASIRGCHRLLSQMLDAAVRSRKLTANPARHVTVKMGPRQKLTYSDVLTATEVAAVTREIKQDRWVALVFCGAWLGWRLGEGLGLRRMDVNLLHSSITIGRQVLEEVDGRQRLRMGAKTEASTGRVVPLPPTVKRVLEKHMEMFVEGAHPETMLFVTADDYHPTRSNLLRQVLRPALARAGITASPAVREARRADQESRWLCTWYDGGGHFTRQTFDTKPEAQKFAAAQVGAWRRIDFRQLRHTAASLMIQAGVDPVDVAHRLGHSRPSITLDVYTHMFKAAEDRGTDLIEQAIKDGEADAR